ncbi:MAG: hypothetical protein ACFB2Z_12025 [Maricaulaceae bacterium]
MRVVYDRTQALAAERRDTRTAPDWVFASGYSRQSNLTVFWGAAAQLGVIGLVLAFSPIAALATALASAVTLFAAAPIVRRATPLRLSADGVELDGLGRVAWPAIRRGALTVIERTKGDAARLELYLGVSLEDALTPDATGPLRSLQTRIWRYDAAARRLILALDPLEDAPNAIAKAVSAFHGREVRTQRY